MYKILKFFSYQIALNDENMLRRTIIVNGGLIVAIIFFSFFTLFNAFFLERLDVALLNAFALFIFSLLLLYIKKTKNIRNAAKFSTFTLMIFLLLFVYSTKNDHFALIWTIFLPIYAIFANGKEKGLYFSLLFYLILFTLSFQGINVWEDGKWTILDWIRLVLASLLMLFAVYLTESSYEIYERKLKKSRKKEKKLIQKLSLLSITDPLTQLYNRRYYDNIIISMVAVAKRDQQCISFFILDIDFFKYYNDHYGHAKGDRVLRKVANLVKKNIQRDNDFVFRLGGEEFAGILISDKKQTAQKWISQLCQKIESLKLEHKKSLCSPYTTVSIGISSKCANETFGVKDLYLQADKALYKAKLQGRNQTVIAS